MAFLKLDRDGKFKKPELNGYFKDLIALAFFKNFDTEARLTNLIATAFLRTVPINTEVFLRGLFLCGKSRS